MTEWLGQKEAAGEADWDAVVWIDDVLGPDAGEESKLAPSASAGQEMEVTSAGLEKASAVQPAGRLYVAAAEGPAVRSPRRPQGQPWRK